MDFEKLKIIVEERVEKLNKSHVFLSICTDNFINDPKCLIELALALLLDKPLFIIFGPEVKPPKNLIRSLSGYVFIKDYKDETIKAAGEKLRQKIEKMIL